MTDTLCSRPLISAKKGRPISVNGFLSWTGHSLCQSLNATVYEELGFLLGPVY